MSYNIDKWKTKKLENLVIPYSAFFKHARTDWHPKEPEVVNADTGEVRLGCGCGQEILGFLKDGKFIVTKFETMSGEGSGTFYGWILRPALEESTGRLEAVLVWEGGDSIQRLQVNDGKIAESEIEL